MAGSPEEVAVRSEVATVRLWPCARPLECGLTLPQDRHDRNKFSSQELKKLLLYAKAKHKKNYPWLSYTVWSHLARSRLQMTEEQAWLYFETFDVVSVVATEERLKMAGMLAQCSSQEERDQLRRKVCVDAPRFFLFLFLLTAPRHSLKASLISGEEWPSPEGEKRHHSSEYAHLAFVKSHISEILGLVAETDEISGRVFLTLDGLCAVELVVQGTRGHTGTQLLVDLATLPTESVAAGYCRSSHTFSLPQLEQWFTRNLTLSPYGPHAIRSGSRDKRCLCFRSENIGRVAANTQLAPSGQAYVLLHKISKQTLAKVEGGLTGNSTVIENCRGSSIYLLAPMKLVHVERCSHCLLVLGSVEMTVTISNCDSLVVVAACRRLHVSSCSLCNFFLLTSTRPVILTTSHQLTFAPYNTNYPQLGGHLRQCGILPTFNLWNQPLCLPTVEEESEVWKEMDPDSFRPFSVPFKLDGDTQRNPCELPKQYEEALKERRDRTKGWYSVVREAHLTEDQSRQLQTSVQRLFHDWLEATGHRKEIVQLEPTKGTPSTTHS